MEFTVSGNSSYEFAINGGRFQDDPIFNNVLAGPNTVVINDKNGCGATEPLPFLVVGFSKFFTPNGDNSNPTWEVYGLDQLGTVSLEVYDRYGKVIRIMNDISGWQ